MCSLSYFLCCGMCFFVWGNIVHYSMSVNKTCFKALRLWCYQRYCMQERHTAICIRCISSKDQLLMPKVEGFWLTCSCYPVLEDSLKEKVPYWGLSYVFSADKLVFSNSSLSEESPLLNQCTASNCHSTSLGALQRPSLSYGGF